MTRRKYIPVNPKAVSSKCSKAYVNVYASSQEEPDAIVCCDGSHPSTSWLTGTYAGALCVPPPKFLPFARRLTKFPDSWLLPLIPILLRVVTVQFRRLFASNGNNIHSCAGVAGAKDAHEPHHHSHWVTFRRLLSYVVIMNFRGWALYILFNMIQDSIASRFSSSWTAGEVGAHDGGTTMDNMEHCWYRELLHSSKQDDPTCYGRRFDFSDHVVLFFGHVLPVVLFEVLFCFLLPFWPSSSVPKVDKKDDQISSASSAREHKLHLPTGVVPIFLLVSFVYLNILVFMAVHRTAAYFHTSTEIVCGYAISLLVQIPLGILLWGTKCLGKWARARALLGLPSYEDMRDDW